MEEIKNIIIGSGVAGLGASHALKQRAEDGVILEQDDTFGGLCGSFNIKASPLIGLFIFLSQKRNRLQLICLHSHALI